MEPPRGDHALASQAVGEQHLCRDIARRQQREPAARKIDGRNLFAARPEIDLEGNGHPGYEVSQRIRKRIEEIFGWLKTVGGLSKTRYRGASKVAWMFTFALCTYNLVRMRNLGLSPP